MAADMAIEPNAGRVPMRGEREVPMPIGYGVIWRRATPNWEMSSRSSPVYSVGSGISLVVRAALVETPSSLRAKSRRAPRCSGMEERPSIFIAAFAVDNELSGEVVRAVVADHARPGGRLG